MWDGQKEVGGLGVGPDRGLEARRREEGGDLELGYSQRRRVMVWEEDGGLEGEWRYRRGMEVKNEVQEEIGGLDGEG